MNEREKRITEVVKERARPFYRKVDGGHDFHHALRVLRLALHLGREEGADPFVLTLSALLHDMGREREDRSNGAVCHAAEGARMAGELLENLSVDPEIARAVIHCVATHRFRGNQSPESLEARVLYDADKLDAIGASGIGRAFLFAGGIGATLHIPDLDIAQSRAYSKEDTAYREFTVKLRHVRDRMLTSAGRRMARERHDFMVQFFHRLDEEIRGKI